MGITATDISQRIIDAVLAQKLAPGTRLGEQPLALLFDCSRTIVREALTRLAARGIVTVSARRGWYLIAPSREEAREAFEARRVIELGLLRGRRALDKPALTRLKKHLAQEKAALRGDDVGARSFLLGDFQVRGTEPASSVVQYRGSSVLRYRMQAELPRLQRAIAMRLPADRDNPRTRALAEAQRWSSTPSSSSRATTGSSSPSSTTTTAGVALMPGSPAACGPDRERRGAA